MTHTFFIGVDGGATKCTVRVEDAAGKLLGQVTNGPANIRISAEQAWDSINTGVTAILEQHGLAINNKDYAFHAGMGLAGTELQSAYQHFLQQPHSFSSLAVVSDAHTACLGAHASRDGAIVVVGTGVIGYQIANGAVTKVGGFGFPHDDEGGGAWLGLEAVKLYLKSLDGRAPVSGLTRAVAQAISAEEEELIAWVNKANSTAFATLAPVVIEQQQQGEATAIALMQQAAVVVARIIKVLQAATPQPLPCALVGGVTPFLLPYLEIETGIKFVNCSLTPDAGAILMVKKALAGGKY